MVSAWLVRVRHGRCGPTIFDYCTTKLVVDVTLDAPLVAVLETAYVPFLTFVPRTRTRSPVHKLGALPAKCSENFPLGVFSKCR